jgi:hypothetical protein
LIAVPLSNGSSLDAIAKELGISRSSASKYLGALAAELRAQRD